MCNHRWKKKTKRQANGRYQPLSRLGYSAGDSTALTLGNLSLEMTHRGCDAADPGRRGRWCLHVPTETAGIPASVSLSCGFWVRHCSVLSCQRLWNSTVQLWIIFNCFTSSPHHQNFYTWLFHVLSFNKYIAFLTGFHFYCDLISLKVDSNFKFTHRTYLQHSG